MNENINLVEILRDCPKGTRLFSPIYGNVKFWKTEEGSVFPICVRNIKDTIVFSLRKDGRIYEDIPESECALLPSNVMRDWSKWFKKGDVLVTHELHPIYAIFKEYTDDSYETFTAAFFALKDSHPKRAEIGNFTTDFSLATEEQKAFFISEIEEEFGGKLNLHTLEIEKGHIFKPFDMVLVRDDDRDKWKCNFFSHYDDKEEFGYECMNTFYAQCIPYEGNEHLLGTTKSPKHE